MDAGGMNNDFDRNLHHAQFACWLARPTGAVSR